MSTIEKDLNPDTYIGISLPVKFGRNGDFNRTKTTLRQTASNIKNLLLTRRGERLGNPTFGSELKSVLFEPMDGNLETKLEESIRASLSEFLPFVNLLDIKFSRSENTISPKIIFTMDIDNTTIEEVNLSLDLSE
jgi:phage baseplate assembly protein W